MMTDTIYKELEFAWTGRNTYIYCYRAKIKKILKLKVPRDNVLLIGVDYGRTHLPTGMAK